jgi:N-acetylglucosaminyldiphosphoundecaprenol N-acetyl-beta-D-mannosaminyltransferase
MTRKKNQTIQIMGYNIYSDRLENIQLSDKLTIVNTLNAYSYVIAAKDILFREALMNSDVLVPDGFPVVLAAHFLKGVKIMKIAGEDLFHYFCNEMNRTSGSIFFLGSSEETLKKILKNLSSEYPRIRVSSYSPPFKPFFCKEDNELMLEKIRLFSPDVLFVGMTAPKQEKWVDQLKGEINAKIVCSIGAVFDFYAGTVKRPSGFWIRLNLEWFIRLLREPKRLWKRYLVYSPLFFKEMIRYKLKRQ